MRTLATAVTTAFLTLVIGGAIAQAEAPIDDGAVATVTAPRTTPEYPILNKGQVVLVNAQRLVVTKEPQPVAKIAEAPPEPEAEAVEKPAPPYTGAIWVAAHWTYGATGLSWVAGRYIAPRAGHVFVPPRWASLDGQYFYFTGFYVPYGVYVRSYFDRYYYSGTPANRAGAGRGPYWPIGAPTRANSALSRANARDPYWPIGVRR